MQSASKPGLRFPENSRILVSETLGEFAWWPRTGTRGDARCFAFQCADILEVWCDTIGRSRGVRPVFVTVLAANGKPAFLLPLGIETHHGIGVLRFLDGGLSDYNAPIVFPDAAGLSAGDAQAIWNELQTLLPRFDLAILDKMPDMVEDAANPLAPLTTMQHPESCHYAILDNCSENFTRERFPNLSDSRRRWRKLDKLSEVKIGIAADHTQCGEFLEAMMRMKRQKFIETKGHDVFTVSGSDEFYRETTRRLAINGPVQLSALSVNGDIIAAHWGYVAGNRFYHLMPAHEAGEWRQYAPGRLLNEWLFEWAINHGIKYFDFGIGDEPYKFDYCDVHVPLRDAYLPATPVGRLYGLMLQWGDTAKHTLRDTVLGPALMAARNRWRNLRA